MIRCRPGTNAGRAKTGRRGSKTGFGAFCARPALRRLGRDRAGDGKSVNASGRGRARFHPARRDRAVE